MSYGCPMCGSEVAVSAAELLANLSVRGLCGHINYARELVAVLGVAA